MRRTLLLLLPIAYAAAQAPKGDSCTPPPAALAPTLPANLLPGMGTVHMPITTSNPEAQKFFDQGLAQLHSFWAREAERSFLQAAALDPAAPMPHWGIAMVAAGDWRPRFQLDRLRTGGARQGSSPALTRARAAAKKAVELTQVPAKATDLEKLYIAAVAARRDVDAKEPEEAFVKGMRDLLAKYPGEVEAQLDLALMIMRSFGVLDHKPVAPGSTEAAAILRDLLKKAPDHPGVHHYVIHAFEGSSFAKDAWPSCEKYTKLVPNIPHALHMPGHIYSQTGRFPDASKAFASAAESERGWMKLDKLYGTSHHTHNVLYLATSYSFDGRFEDAIQAANELLAVPEGGIELPNTSGVFAKVRAFVQFQKWDQILDSDALPESTKPRHEALRQWARAIAFASKRNVAAAREAAASFEKLTVVDTPENRSRNQVMRDELAAQILIADGQIDRGLEQLEAASVAERRLAYSEPPPYPRPIAEALGQAALKHNKPAIAERAFRIALDQYPGNTHAERGLRAARDTRSLARARL